MRVAIMLLVIASLYSVGDAADLVEVPLPDLAGYYSNTTRTCEFELLIPPIEVYNVWIRYSGTANVGEEYCYIVGPPPEGPFPWPLIFSANMPDAVSGDSWYAEESAPDESKAFEMTVPFGALLGDDPTWEFLLSGSGTVSCHGYISATIPECYIDINPDATVEEATLIIEGEFLPIGVEVSTWGHIKALYR